MAESLRNWVPLLEDSALTVEAVACVFVDILTLFSQVGLHTSLW